MFCVFSGRCVFRSLALVSFDWRLASSCGQCWFGQGSVVDIVFEIFGQSGWLRWLYASKGHVLLACICGVDEM